MNLKRLLALLVLTCMLTVPTSGGEVEMPPAPEPTPQPAVTQPAPEPTSQALAETTLPTAAVELLAAAISSLLSSAL